MSDAPIRAHNPEELYNHLVGLGLGGASEATLTEGLGTAGSIEFTASGGTTRSIVFDLMVISANDAAALIRSASNLRDDGVSSRGVDRITRFR